MMTRLFVALYIASSTFFFTASVSAQSLPSAPTGYVNDFANVLSAETTRELESELTTYDASTSNQIAIAIVKNMQGDYIEHFATKLFEKWKIGTDKNDNGILLIVAVEEHKLRIEVGYGLGGALPDSLAQRILDNEMTPRLKAGDYDSAITNAVHAIEKATRGEYTPTAPPVSSEFFTWLFENGSAILVGFLILLQWLVSILGRSRSWWAGGVLGFVGAIGAGWFFTLPTLAIASLAAPLTIFGLLFDYIVSSAYRGASMRGTTPPWWTGGNTLGGGHSGSSGGFGGFGGGSSGGGGASGSW